MKFCIINPTERTANMMDAPDFETALSAAGLKSGEIDFGSLTRFLHIAVYEFGLYVSLQNQRYFSIGRNLYVGNGLLFACDDEGITVSLTKPPPIMFYKGPAEVERAIQRNEIDRPQIVLNGMCCGNGRSQGGNDGW